MRRDVIARPMSLRGIRRLNSFARAWFAVSACRSVPDRCARRFIISASGITLVSRREIGQKEDGNVAQVDLPGDSSRLFDERAVLRRHKPAFERGAFGFAVESARERMIAGVSVARFDRSFRWSDTRRPIPRRPGTPPPIAALNRDGAMAADSGATSVRAERRHRVGCHPRIDRSKLVAAADGSTNTAVTRTGTGDHRRVERDRHVLIRSTRNVCRTPAAEDPQQPTHPPDSTSSKVHRGSAVDDRGTSRESMRLLLESPHFHSGFENRAVAANGLRSRSGR